ncbi:hypothetical protein FQA39_LY07539 [Lamprigera yunnana]|nr:hypothetical protein FQA39_LY07539 [Lamprigera yunnana]
MASTFFSWLDYVIFAVISASGCAIGIFFGFYSKQSTAHDYLFGGKKVKWFPIAMSLVASAFSGLSLLGLPTEVYLYGTQVTVMTFSIILAGWLNYVIYIPVFYNLQVGSIYEYIEGRYNRHLKAVLSFLSIINNITTLPIFMYVPSLIFSQVSGVDLHTIAPIMIIICIFYTAVGGIKAVVWADTLQFFITVLTLIIIIILGIIKIGGITVVFEKSQQGNRLELFNFNLDPTIRMSFWSVLIGNVFSWSGMISIAPPEVQRYVALPKRTDIKKVLIIFTVLISIMKTICVFLGLIIHAKYFECDPKSMGEIKKADQIVPYFITEIVGDLMGLSGLFMAAFFGTAFSTFSTLLNNLSGMIYTDFGSCFIPNKLLKEKPAMILKLLTTFIGLSSIGLIYLLEHVGTVFEVVYYFKGITGGAGAISGGITSITLMSVIIIKNQMYIWNGVIKHQTKSLHTYGCNSTNSSTVFATTMKSLTSTLLTDNLPPTTANEEPFWLFRISFQYYYLIGTMTTVIVGLLASWLTRKKSDMAVDPDYISPFVNNIRKKLWPPTKLEKEAEPLKATDNI